MKLSFLIKACAWCGDFPELRCEGSQGKSRDHLTFLWRWTCINGKCSYNIEVETVYVAIRNTTILNPSRVFEKIHIITAKWNKSLYDQKWAHKTLEWKDYLYYLEVKKEYFEWKRDEEEK